MNFEKRSIRKLEKEFSLGYIKQALEERLRREGFIYEHEVVSDFGLNIRDLHNAAHITEDHKVGFKITLEEEFVVINHVK